MLSFSGPTAEVEYLARRIAQLGRADFTRTLMDDMARAAEDLVDREFINSTDPYGERWAPRKRPRSGRQAVERKLGPGWTNPVLVKTGKMMRSVRRYVSFAGFTLKVRAPYSEFHQHGTRVMVARRILPDDRGLPRAWAVEFERIADKAIRTLVGSAAGGMLRAA